jgi:hypothetical protein
MPSQLHWFAGAALLILATACSQTETRGPESTAGGQTAFPSEYRSWRKLNAAPIIRDAERQARDLYANETAFHKDGGSFAVGSILVKEERGLQVDPGGRLKPGDVIRVSVMFKVGQGATSGWSFKAFDPGTRQEVPRDRIDPDGCYYCHADASARDYVYSEVK